MREKYFNTPLPEDVANEIKRQAKANGRRPAREISQIVIHTIRRSRKCQAAAATQAQQ